MFDNVGNGLIDFVIAVLWGIGSVDAIEIAA